MLIVEKLRPAGLVYWKSVLSVQFFCKIKTAQKIKPVNFFKWLFLTFSVINCIMISCSEKLTTLAILLYTYINYIVFFLLLIMIYVSCFIIKYLEKGRGVKTIMLELYHK